MSDLDEIKQDDIDGIDLAAFVWGERIETMNEKEYLKKLLDDLTSVLNDIWGCEGKDDLEKCIIPSIKTRIEDIERAEKMIANVEVQEKIDEEEEGTSRR